MSSADNKLLTVT